MSTSKVKKVYVKRLNNFPEAAFVFEVNDQTVSFDAGNSRFDESLDDTTLWYSWDFDITEDHDGNGINNDDDQDNTIDPVYIYPEPGEYKVRLTIKDKLSTTDVVERVVRVGNLNQPNSIVREKESLSITSANLMSSLSLSMPDRLIEKDDTVDIKAKILQANGEVYNETVFYKIIEGSGNFIPGEVRAREGLAISTFKADAPGLIIVEVTVPLISG